MRLQPEHLANAVKALALHNLGAGAGKKPLVLLGIAVIEVGSHHGIEDGVAQELQALVVSPPPVAGLHWHGSVHQSELVILDVKRIKPCYAMNKNVKSLFLSEKELYDRYDSVKQGYV